MAVNLTEYVIGNVKRLGVEDVECGAGIIPSYDVDAGIFICYCLYINWGL